MEALLETDTDGVSGVFSSEIEEPEHANAGTMALWELHFLSVSFMGHLEYYDGEG